MGETILLPLLLLLCMLLLPLLLLLLLLPLLLLPAARSVHYTHLTGIASTCNFAVHVEQIAVPLLGPPAVSPPPRLPCCSSSCLPSSRLTAMGSALRAEPVACDERQRC